MNIGLLSYVLLTKYRGNHGVTSMARLEVNTTSTSLSLSLYLALGIQPLYIGKPKPHRKATSRFSSQQSQLRSKTAARTAGNVTVITRCVNEEDF